MSVEMEMPRYVSHKQVWALKIKAIEPFGADGMFALLHFEDPRYAPIAVDADWYYGRKPEAGGYYVVYKDGYTSYSPAKAFDEGYTPENAAQAPASPEWLRNAVLEEAAQACERQERLRNRKDAQAVCRLCARDIRALKASAVVNQQLTTDQAPAANGDALDAARYRWLRSPDNPHGPSLVAFCKPDELDAAIDDARQRAIRGEE